jgi:ribosomal-protein-alanine N-acetyltransferase
MIDAGVCLLRAWEERDVEPAAALANDWEVARFMSDRFPHPYTVADARGWIDRNRAIVPTEQFAIVAGGALVGGIGIERKTFEFRRTFHIGYWIATAYHGRGIATAACRALTDHTFATTDALRLETHVYAPNFTSARVLEKCGYVREGVLRNAVTKGENTYDAYLYAKVRT